MFFLLLDDERTDSRPDIATSASTGPTPIILAVLAGICVLATIGVIIKKKMNKSENKSSDPGRSINKKQSELFLQSFYLVSAII